MLGRLLVIWLCVLIAGTVGTWAACKVAVAGADYHHQSMILQWGTVLSVGLSVAAATMLLCGFKRVRANAALRFLSFYLAPLVLSAMTLSGVKDGYELLDEAHILFAPFFVCLTAGYVWFSRKVLS